MCGAGVSLLLSCLIRPAMTTGVLCKMSAVQQQLVEVHIEGPDIFQGKSCQRGNHNPATCSSPTAPAHNVLTLQPI